MGSTRSTCGLENLEEMVELDVGRASFRDEVLSGLKKAQKAIPSKYLYDERGSELFDQICEVDEYYPTRTELKITRDNIGEIVEVIGPHCQLIEFGSGASVKTRILLDALKSPASYVPIDISGDYLAEVARGLAEDYPDLVVQPVCADFTQCLEIPDPPGEVGRRVVYFPGSTIGNFAEEDAKRCLAQVRQLGGEGAGLLIGVDIKKDRKVLEAAYNDAEGVTEEFTLNLLDRINRELDGDFDKSRFAHRAVYNDDDGRVNVYLESLSDQEVTVGSELFEFEKGETILAEWSHKYSPSDFQSLAQSVGLKVDKVWYDEKKLFSVQFLTACA